MSRPATCHRIRQGSSSVSSSRPASSASLRDPQGQGSPTASPTTCASSATAARVRSGSARATSTSARALWSNGSALPLVPRADKGARQMNTSTELRVDPDYENRNGYSANVLGIEVPLPIAHDELADDLVSFGDGKTVLPYEHFSLAMSRSRRLAVYTAVNLDGERTVDTGPRKNDQWIFDTRLPEDVQIGSFLYDGTPFDKGHLVRRLDPVWGETPDEALRAEADTFHYTNCSPQHEKFNRSKELWQGIENYILDNTDLFHLRVCLFNGPVFALDDPTVKDVPIPREYWKVVTIRKADGSLSATA